LCRWGGSCSSRIAGSSGKNSPIKPVSTSYYRAGRGIVDDDELVELVADALGRDDLELAPISLPG
jgi:hypothetical protein